MMDSETQSLLKNISVYLYNETWSVRDRCSDDIKTQLVKQFNIQAIDDDFSNCMFASDSAFVDPVFHLFKSKLEPMIKSLKVNQQMKYANLYKLAKQSAKKEFYGYNEAASFLLTLLDELQLPIYSRPRTTKVNHVTFHYFALCVFYLASRLCAKNPKESYVLANRFARFSAVGGDDHKLIESYRSEADIERYCQEEGLLFNVCIHALSDCLPDGYIYTKSFIVLQKSSNGKYKIHGVFSDEGEGISQAVRSKELAKNIMTGVRVAIKVQAGNRLRNLIEKQSIQNNYNDIKTSLRILTTYDDFIILKSTQLKVNSEIIKSYA